MTALFCACEGAKRRQSSQCVTVAGLVSGTLACVFEERQCWPQAARGSIGSARKNATVQLPLPTNSTPGLTGPLTAVQLMVELKVASSTQAGSGMPLVVPL